MGAGGLSPLAPLVLTTAGTSFDPVASNCVRTLRSDPAHMLVHAGGAAAARTANTAHFSMTRGGGSWHANRHTSGQLSFEGSWILLLNNNSRELVPITDCSDTGV